MGTIARRATATLVAVVVTLGGLLLVPSPAQAAPSARTYEVVGQITGPQATLPRISVRWFTKDWTYLGQKKLSGDIYSLSLAPGTYHLQFVDQRPAYDVTKYAPTDVTVTLANRKIQRNVRMQRGAAITGTVKAGGRAARGARVVAANTFEQSYETTANAQGQFAIGGLPSGKYSVFTYDRTQTWVDKSVYAGKVSRGQFKNIRVALRKKGGSLLVDLFRGDGTRAKGRFAVTAVSKRTGQFWTETARSGKVTFRGLYPGGYRLVAPGNGDWLARTGTIQGAKVRSGRADLASRFVWTQRGATITGRVVDGSDPSYGLAGAQVLLFDRSGAQVASTTSGNGGTFSFGTQLTSQTGMKVVAQPGTRAPYLGENTHYCKFGQGTSAAFAVATNRTTDVGGVAVPRLPVEQQDDATRCAS
jgi:hypothetical protein